MSQTQKFCVSTQLRALTVICGHGLDPQWKGNLAVLGEAGLVIPTKPSYQTGHMWFRQSDSHRMRLLHCAASPGWRNWQTHGT